MTLNNVGTEQRFTVIKDIQESKNVEDRWSKKEKEKYRENST